MPEPWTGEIVGKMHNENITLDMLAGKMGIKKAYLSQILNSKRTPKDIENRTRTALDELLSGGTEANGT